MHGQIQGVLAFYQSYLHHLVRWYLLWNILFPVTEIWGSWSKNEPSEISKDDQKKIECVYRSIPFQIYTGVLST